MYVTSFEICLQMLSNTYALEGAISNRGLSKSIELQTKFHQSNTY